jgi:hypothetical protein
MSWISIQQHRDVRRRPQAVLDAPLPIAESRGFCKTCGIFTYIGDGENTEDGYRVNLGCVEGLDPLALEVSIIDGKALPVIEEPG